MYNDNYAVAKAGPRDSVVGGGVSGVDASFVRSGDLGSGLGSGLVSGLTKVFDTGSFIGCHSGMILLWILHDP